jgi:hypothetical protein
MNISDLNYFVAPIYLQPTYRAKLCLSFLNISILQPLLIAIMSTFRDLIREAMHVLKSGLSIVKAIGDWMFEIPSKVKTKINSRSA